MYVNLFALSQWVLDNSPLFASLLENEEKDQITYIPFLTKYDEKKLDFSELFMKDEPYLYFPIFLRIYFDAIQLLDFIQMDIPLHQLIKPDDYSDFLPYIKPEIRTHLQQHLIGIQHYAFGFEHHPIAPVAFGFDSNDSNEHHPIGFNSDDSDDLSEERPHLPLRLDNRFRESLEANQENWLLWFCESIQCEDDLGIPLTIYDVYEESIWNFDFTYLSTKVFLKLLPPNFDWMQPNLFQKLIEKEKIEIIELYFQNRISEKKSHHELYFILHHLIYPAISSSQCQSHFPIKIIEIFLSYFPDFFKKDSATTVHMATLSHLLHSAFRSHNPDLILFIIEIYQRENIFPPTNILHSYIDITIHDIITQPHIHQQKLFDIFSKYFPNIFHHLISSQPSP